MHTAALSAGAKVEGCGGEERCQPVGKAYSDVSEAVAALCHVPTLQAHENHRPASTREFSLNEGQTLLLTCRLRIMQSAQHSDRDAHQTSLLIALSR